MSFRNTLLGLLPPQDLERLLPRIEEFPLMHKSVLHHPGHPIDHLYFVEDGLISVVAETQDASQGTEAWIIGHEGVCGLPVILGAETSPHRRMVQAQGRALRVPATDLRRAMDEMPALREVLLRYVYSVFVQVSLSAACNAKHSREHRLARWVLVAHDRLDRDTLPFSDDIVGKMLGAPEAEVPPVVQALEEMGAIRGDGESIHVLDRSKLERLTCGCYPKFREAMRLPQTSRGEGH